MAEPSDRPAAAGSEPHPKLRAAPPPAFGADGSADAPAYQPLSIPAILGLFVAALYAVFLVLCWVVAVFSGTPLLMSSATLLLPVAALILSAVGWLQVQRSEGTRAGGKLALWGMALSGLFGLSYTAYIVASYAALRQQAETFATQWMDLVRDGNLDEAFRLTLAPSERPRPGDQLRRELEIRFNTGQGPRPGALTVFRESDAVRLLNHGLTREDGAETVVRPMGVKVWEYHNNGYHVVLNYEVRTPERVAELQVGLQGTENHQEGRQWAILAAETWPVNILEELPLGNRITDLRTSSGSFVAEWGQKLRDGRLENAYLDTQEPAQRQQLRATYGARLLAAGLASEGLGAALNPQARGLTYLPGYREFCQGSLVHADPETFWADGPQRTQIPAEIKTLFAHPAEAFAPSAQSDRVRWVAWARDGDKLRFLHDFHLTVYTHYTVHGAMVVETDAHALDDTASGSAPWRLARIDLYDGRSLVASGESSGTPPR